MYAIQDIITGPPRWTMKTTWKSTKTYSNQIKKTRITFILKQVGRKTVSIKLEEIEPHQRKNKSEQKQNWENITATMRHSQSGTTNPIPYQRWDKIFNWRNRNFSEQLNNDNKAKDKWVVCMVQRKLSHRVMMLTIQVYLTVIELTLEEHMNKVSST